MKISTEIGSIATLCGEEKAIDYVAKAGFDGWDCSISSMCPWDWENCRPILSSHPFFEKSYLSYAKRLKQIGLDNGIVCNQSHAPFPSYEANFGYIWRAIEFSAEVGAEICVVHPNNYFSAEQNAEMYGKLLPFAKAHNVKIATENMWNMNFETNTPTFAACSTLSDFKAHLDAINDEYFVACLDIGHAEMQGVGSSAVEMIKGLGNRLKALHIHDNDKLHDLHNIPFSMKIEFVAVVQALKEIGYKGYLSLEANSYLKEYKEENVFEGIKALAESAKRMAKLFEK